MEPDTPMIDGQFWMIDPKVPETPTDESFQTRTPEELETFWAVWVTPGWVVIVPTIETGSEPVVVM